MNATKQDKLWVKVGKVAFTCNTIEDAAKRVQLLPSEQEK